MRQHFNTILYRIIHLDITEWLDKLRHDPHPNVVYDGVLKYKEKNEV